MTAPASCGPMREIALLIDDARPALATGTEDMRAAVRGATRMPRPMPKTIDAGRKSIRNATGGRNVLGSSGRNFHAVLVGGIRAYSKTPAAIIRGPTIRKRRGP